MKISINNHSLNVRAVNVLNNRGNRVCCMLTPKGNDKLLLMAIGRLKKKYNLTDNDLVYNI